MNQLLNESCNDETNISSPYYDMSEIEVKELTKPKFYKLCHGIAYKIQGNKCISISFNGINTGESNYLLNLILENPDCYIKITADEFWKIYDEVEQFIRNEY